MGKRVRATYIAALEALKAHGCISDYSIVGNEVKPEWMEGGADRVVQEVTTNPKPFGLNTSQRSGLLMVLPQKESEKAGAILLNSFKIRHGLVLVFLFLMLGLAAAQQSTNNLSDITNSIASDTIEQITAKAEAGDPEAQFKLTMCYFNGDGVPQSQNKALDWCAKAAKQGLAPAQYALGNAYANAYFLRTHDYNEAAKWYLKAAEQGFAKAQSILGSYYASGKGVARDDVLACKWLYLAASQGDEDAKRLLPDSEEKLTPEKISEAQQLAREFKPSKPYKLGSFVLNGGNAGGNTNSDPYASGTGFFITDDGYLISNNHVVEGANRVRLVTSTGTIDAKVVQVDAANDLALLKVDGNFSPLPILPSRSAHLGGTVATIGFPDTTLQGFSPKLAKGEIASLSGAGDDPRYFQISVPVQPGNSGGALVDERGNVIGIVSAKLNASAALAASGALPENVNYAVKSSLLLSFLESVPAVSAKLKAPNTKDEKFEDVVKSAQDAAVLVLVY